ncbi:MAG: ABC transporter permease subunit [Deltaproteobacteria bacterium]|nr:ABC transporter permease subunit [Deltaproteobacteria bacterium]
MQKALGAIGPYAISLGLWAALIETAHLIFGAALSPSPMAILIELFKLTVAGDLFKHLGLTVARAICGVLLANMVGSLLGLAAGRAARTLKFTAPLVASLQSCPPVVWISLAMVFAGTGSIVPLATVFASTLPFVFSNTAQGVLGLDPRLSAVSKLYQVPRSRVFTRFIVPAVAPYWLAGLSTVLATGWKAAAVAEFMGSHDGVGARLFWSYNNLNMEQLHAWALALIALGLTLEGLVITPLRRWAASLSVRGKL